MIADFDNGTTPQDPVGGSFGNGVVMLTAVRTIVNDDGAWV